MSCDTAGLRTLFLSYLAVSNQHNVTEMQKYYADPIYINGAPLSPSAVTDQFLPLWEGFPDWTWDAKNLTVEGDNLALLFNQTGTHTGTYMGTPPTGQQVVSFEYSLYHVENEKITQIFDINDRDQAIEDAISG